MENTDCIKLMIKARIKVKPLPEVDLNDYQIDNLPLLSIWGTPEGTIFVILNSYFIKRSSGMRDLEIIKELAEERGYGSSYCRNIEEYIYYVIEREHSMFSYLYTDDLIHIYYDLIWDYRKKLPTKYPERNGIESNNILDSALSQKSNYVQKESDYSFFLFCLSIFIWVLMFGGLGDRINGNWYAAFLYGSYFLFAIWYLPFFIILKLIQLIRGK